MKRKYILWSILATAIVFLVTLSIFTIKSAQDAPTKQTFNEFISLIQSEEVVKIEYIDVYENSGNIEYSIGGEKFSVKLSEMYFTFNSDLLMSLSEKSIPVEFKSPVTATLSNILKNLTTILFIVLAVFIMFMYFRMSSENINISTATNEKTKLSDIAGYEHTRAEIAEIIKFFKDSRPYDKLGSKLPKGILLKGPPGTGKTLFARAIAGEVNVPFFYISASKLENKWVGSGSRRIEKILKKVEKAADKYGKAIIFIDEIDAVGMDRQKRTVVETNQTLNSLLTIMDGFTKTNILFVAATNLAESLDPALVRSGRFDKQLYIPLPNAANRKAILKLYLDQRKDVLSDEILEKDYIDALVGQTQGMCCADLKELVNEAGIIAASQQKTYIDIDSLRQSLLKFRIGTKSDVEISETDKNIIAYHEAGHAVAQILTDERGYRSIAHITIQPYGSAMGHVAILPKDSIVKRISELENTVMVLLAGRAVEEKLLNGDFTTGASSDLQRANKILANYIGTYGMSKNSPNMYLDRIDLNNRDLQTDIKQIRDSLYKKVQDTLEENYHLVEKVAQHLLEYQDISQEELPRILNIEV